MPLPAGTRLGPYEILSPIGAGGMGEVYKGRDTRLDRVIAIKVLAPKLSAREDFRQRFQREARIISSLNHPHICQLYDIGHEEQMDFLVMEYLDGETMAARINRGALPLEQALRYGIQIADALDCAHRRNIIHRDLKPGNIMLTGSGVKLLDFGLAYVDAARQAAPGTSEMLTETAGGSLTAEGTILGTPEYMAPEQLEGRPADARSDLFAFGVVLFEMITGRKAFTGKTRPSIMAAILEHEPPPLQQTVPSASPVLEAIVTSCLTKDPGKRWQSAADLRTALQWASTMKPAAAGSRPRRFWPWAASVVVFGGALLALSVLRRPGAPATLRFSIPVKAAPMSLAVSPDAGQIAYTASENGGEPALWIRPMDAATDRKLTGSEGAEEPFWSPDGRFIGFCAGGKLKKVSVSGGPPQIICKINSDLGASWNKSGDIVVAPWNRVPLHRVAASGGDLTAVTALDTKTQNSHRWPQFLPDDKHFLFTARGALAADTTAYIGSLDSKNTTRLLSVHSNVAYTPPGSLLFVREGILLAQPFDAVKGALKGEPVPVAEHVRQITDSAHAYFSVSANGQMLAWLQEKNSKSTLTWFDRSGKKLSEVGTPDSYKHLRLSPDGRRAAVVLTDADSGNRDIWIVDTSTGVRTRFTVNQATDWFPVWSPDGSRIAFSSDRNGLSSIYSNTANGSGEEQHLSTLQRVSPNDWSRDGRYLAFQQDMPNSLEQLWLLPLAAGGQPISFMKQDFMLSGQRFSPDSKWIAYGSLESGAWEIYVGPVENSGGARPKWKISSGGGYQAVWRPDGKELFYLAPDGTLMAVDVKLGSNFDSGAPRPLFRLCSNSMQRLPYQSTYGVDVEGRRFLAVCLVAEAEPSSIEVLTNWQAKLNR